MLPTVFAARPNHAARRALAASAAAAALAAGAYACKDSTSPADNAPRRVYGQSVALGAGHARSFVLLDANSKGGAPLEFGVAFDEGAMQALPTPMPMPAGTDPHAHADSHEYLLPLPAENPTPYKLVELDWNPGGHEPPGIYDVPHFDFHFYTITKAERDAIDPAVTGQGGFMTKSAALPPAGQVAPVFVALAAPGDPVVAVPHMGVHWVDVRSPELQGMLGHPEAYKPFTTTFIHGSWDGRFIFDEPMITRAHILAKKDADVAKRDELVPLPVGAQATTAGYQPSAYRISWDAEAKEYRVALAQLQRRG